MDEMIDPAGFRALFIHDAPMLDVRAPVEFQHGAFPGARNLPLLDNAEREQVGTVYRRAGREAAVTAGHQLVSGAVKATRLQAWVNFAQQHPDEGVLYCFRGGQRSRIVQAWMREAGVTMPRVSGGYKALRRYLINTLEQTSTDYRFLVVGGKTGSGKTRLLNNLPCAVDLEGLANHRGSAFGPRVQQQPGQIDFENRLAIAMLKLDRHTPGPVFLEDESRAIGSLSVPQVLHERMRRSPLIVIEEPREQRADVILNDYIHNNFLDFQAHDPIGYWPLFGDYLQQSLGRIRRRLGEELYREIAADMGSALADHAASGNVDAHRPWIAKLLQHYYDPMYDYQLGKKLDRVVFRGNSQEFLQWASRLTERASQEETV